MGSHHLSARRNPKGVPLFLSFLVLLTVLTACDPAQSKSGQQIPLSIDVAGAPPLVDNFNPYSPNGTVGAQGNIYETLFYFNRLTGHQQGWLATSYNWSAQLTSLTFHLRQGVTWSDGQAFTSADVVFTLNLIKKNTSIDSYSIGPLLKNVQALDASTVVVTLVKPFTPLLWYLAGQTWILPQHLWSSVTGDPAQYTNPHPVGTGPYLLESFTPQVIKEKKNPNYWQPGKPAVNELIFPTYSGNNSAELALDSGQTTWDQLFIPNIQQTFGQRDPAHNYYWFPANNIVFLLLNLTRFPFNQLAVRQAISIAIDRKQISQAAESGYADPASPTGLVLPANQTFLNPAYAHTTFASPQPDVAKQTLQAAGYTLGKDGFFADNSGRKLSVHLAVPSGWTDWDTTCQIIASNLKAAGIEVKVDFLDPTAWSNEGQNGTFDMTLNGVPTGPTPYFQYDQLLRSTDSAPVGKTAQSNWERWIDPTKTDQLLDQFSTTTDRATQVTALNEIQNIMVTQLPIIPLFNSPYWFEANTTHFTGWPTVQNPYAVPANNVFPDEEVVLLHLQPV